MVQVLKEYKLRALFSYSVLLLGFWSFASGDVKSVVALVFAGCFMTLPVVLEHMERKAGVELEGRLKQLEEEVSRVKSLAGIRAFNG